VRARIVVCMALLVASCGKKETPAPAPPKPVQRPRPHASDAAPQAFPDSCARAAANLIPDRDAHDSRVVLVLFWAVWSAPDRLLIKAVESELARDAERWRLIKIDIDEHPDPAKDCDIRSVPTLVAFVNGKPVSQIVGAVPAARVRRFLEAIPSNGP
jgi:thiol-disulfide isomerase/thioredoxin